MRKVYLGGEKLSAELVKAVQTKHPSVQVYNSYGPTEVTIFSNQWLCPKDDFVSVPIGSPTPNVACYVVDAHKQASSVPIGVAGMLCLCGPKVSRGYIGQPDLTAASFVHTAIDARTSLGRMYRTGDRVRWLHNGDIEFLGRVDFQIKLNGQRVEAGEVEAVARQTSGVRDALVELHKSEAGANQLVVYVVPQGVSTAAVKQTCQDQLPPYMVPSVVLSLATWPLNSSGKVARKALPAPASAVATELTEVYAKGSIELAVATQCAQVLRCQLPPKHVDLATFGLNSLSAVQLQQRLSKQGMQIRSLSDFMLNTTVAKLSRLLHNQQPTMQLPKQMILLHAPASVDALQPPLFLMAPALGLSACYMRLAARLVQDGSPRVIYGLDNAEMCHVNTLAQHHADCVQRAAPAGPVHLGGWSLGGTVSVEVARILQESGRQVLSIFILDAGDLATFYDTAEVTIERREAQGALVKTTRVFTADYEPPVQIAASTRVLFCHATLEDDGSVKSEQSHWCPNASDLHLINVQSGHDDILVSKSAFALVAETVAEHLATADVAAQSDRPPDLASW